MIKHIKFLIKISG
ncbi:MAG: hypothetical protein K9K84_06130 [Methylovulum sp.]|nr:hypothetical protein [Methylovulum sp.]